MPTPPPLLDARFKLLSGLPKPDFMLIGAAKSGTTSLSSYLSRHPGIAPVSFKEPNFFTWQLMPRERYQRLFVNKRRTTRAAQLAGDYSTSYLLHPLAPRRIAARLPETKCVALLRNPTERAYSHFVMQQRQGVESGVSFEDIVTREIEEMPSLLAAHRRGFNDANPRTVAHRSSPNGQPLEVSAHDKVGSKYTLENEERLFQYYVTSYVLRSIYADQVERWMSLFPPTQLKLIEAEQFFDQRYQTVNEICEFLQLPHREFDSRELDYSLGGGASNLVESPGDYEPMSEKARSLLDTFFKPYNKRLVELSGQQFSWA